MGFCMVSFVLRVKKITDEDKTLNKVYGKLDSKITCLMIKVYKGSLGLIKTDLEIHVWKIVFSVFNTRFISFSLLDKKQYMFAK